MKGKRPSPCPQPQQGLGQEEQGQSPPCSTRSVLARAEPQSSPSTAKAMLPLPCAWQPSLQSSAGSTPTPQHACSLSSSTQAALQPCQSPIELFPHPRGEPSLPFIPSTPSNALLTPCLFHLLHPSSLRGTLSPVHSALPQSTGSSQPTHH